MYISKLRTDPATRDQWHDEQSEELQFEQPDPDPVDEDLNLNPTENPKEDIFFVGLSLPQDGQAGSSLLKTIISNSFPHFSHIYSKMGIADYPPHFALDRFISREISALSFFKESIYGALSLSSISRDNAFSAYR